MPLYVCIVFDRQDTVVAIETLSADTDTLAIDKAKQLAAAKSPETGRGYELWCSGRKVVSRLKSRGRSRVYPGEVGAR